MMILLNGFTYWRAKKMKLITNLDAEQFKTFNENHQYGQMLQSEEWGRFKSRGEWTYELLGLEDDGDLVGVAMLLKRKMPVVGVYMYYASRGFVCDFDDLKVVNEFSKLLVEYVKKHKGMMLKIDPCVVYQERDWEGEIIEGGYDHKALVNNLISQGYLHKGITLDFDGVQPRFVYKLALDRPLDQLLKKFHHKTRYNIKLATKKGIEIYEGNKNDLKEFTRIMKVTGQRDGFITRPLSYFEAMYDELVPAGKLKLYMAKYNLAKALKNNEVALNAEEMKKKPDDNRITKLKKEILELESLVKQYPKGIIVSGTIMLINGKTAIYLYGASDNLYRNVMPNYLIQWKMIQDAYNMGCTMYDFRGISGDRSPDNHLYGLYRFKKGFTGDFIEYIGEFDYVTRPFFYNLYEKGLPAVKKLRRKLKLK